MYCINANGTFHKLSTAVFPYFNISNAMHCGTKNPKKEGKVILTVFMWILDSGAGETALTFLW